ncbi:hypothetical protein A2U01_0056890, partial [Trifolium medium]|nr:hypothetical protein [Trifolium medium]
SPEQDKATSEPEIETSPDSEEIPFEQPIPEQPIPEQPPSEQPIPDQTSEQLPINTVIQNSSEVPD